MIVRVFIPMQHIFCLLYMLVTFYRFYYRTSFALHLVYYYRTGNWRKGENLKVPFSTKCISLLFLLLCLIDDVVLVVLVVVIVSFFGHSRWM